MTAVIFDMDGVILDSEPLWQEQQSLKYKEHIPAWSDEDRKKLVGRPLQGIQRYLKETHDLEISDDEIHDLYDEISLYVYHHAPLRDGATQLLHDLAERGVPLALATSARRKSATFILEKHQLKEMFSVVVSGDDITHGKPHPDAFLLTAKKLGVSPENCVVIEDSDNGIAAAKAADMRCIGVEGSDQHLHGADVVVKEMHDVEAHIFGDAE